MKLTDYEKSILAGDFGEEAKRILEVMVKLYEINHAKGFIEVKEVMLASTQNMSIGGEMGVITEVDHELRGKELKGKILVLPSLKGSAGAMLIIIRLAANGKGPGAIVISQADTILVGAVIIGGIPTVDSLPADRFQALKSGHFLRVDGTKGTVEIVA